MRSFDDSHGQHWQAALLDGSYGNVMLVFSPMLASAYGLSLALTCPTAAEWRLLAGVLAAGFLAGLIPAWRAYRISLADGLNAST